jgi:hypothetical protein
MLTMEEVGRGIVVSSELFICTQVLCYFRGWSCLVVVLEEDSVVRGIW